jgi:hypothetical protein
VLEAKGVTFASSSATCGGGARSLCLDGGDVTIQESGSGEDRN